MEFRHEFGVTKRFEVARVLEDSGAVGEELGEFFFGADLARKASIMEAFDVGVVRVLED